MRTSTNSHTFSHGNYLPSNIMGMSTSLLAAAVPAPVHNLKSGEPQKDRRTRADEISTRLTKNSQFLAMFSSAMIFRIRTQIFVRVCLVMCKHSQTISNTHVLRTSIHRYIHMYACIHTYIHEYIHTYLHSYMHACIHTYIHARVSQMQICTRKYTQIALRTHEHRHMYALY